MTIFRAQTVKIKDFKGIGEATLNLGSVNVLVGANNSGKSSILQAIHFAFHSLRSADARYQRGGNSFAADMNRLAYTPTPMLFRIAHTGNLQTKTELRPEIKASVEIEGNLSSEQCKYHVDFTQGRNQSLSFRHEGSQLLFALIKDTSAEFTAFIPGLSGIPISEEERPYAAISQRAASGDANTVLRNILLLLQNNPDPERDYNENQEDNDLLKELIDWMRELFPYFDLNVDYNPKKSPNIFVDVKMPYGDGTTKWLPIEVVGTGALQLLQIFSYLLLFRPVILLVDEPDAHLHPDRQEKIMPVLERAADKIGSQIVLTTHSPHLVRGMSQEANIIWLEEGGVVSENPSNIKKKMRWGILDKKCVLITEDTDVSKIKLLLAQWPYLEQCVSIWPVHGVSNLPNPNAIQGLVELLADTTNVVIHRDRDFMNSYECQVWSDQYRELGAWPWVTSAADIDAYFADANYLAALFGISEDQAQSIIYEAVQEKWRESTVNEKREQVNRSQFIYKRGEGRPSLDEVLQELGRSGTVDGHTLLRQVRELLKSRDHDEKKVMKDIPESVELAPDLRQILEKATCH